LAAAAAAAAAASKPLTAAADLDIDNTAAAAAAAGVGLQGLVAAAEDTTPAPGLFTFAQLEQHLQQQQQQQGFDHTAVMNGYTTMLNAAIHQHGPTADPTEVEVRPHLLLWSQPHTLLWCRCPCRHVGLGN
jgi:hypothetical protein